MKAYQMRGFMTHADLEDAQLCDPLNGFSLHEISEELLSSLEDWRRKMATSVREEDAPARVTVLVLVEE